uniref:CENP-T/Histone H4 histone fold domain-containing protein n=1 Tax=Magallana gigas TaxID=29159 RepID=A0A8W8KC89_MAGGI
MRKRNKLEMEKDTPRTLIQGLINASQTNETKRPVRKRQVSKTPEVDNRLSRSLPSAEIGLGKREEDIPRTNNRKYHFNEMEKDLDTPRTLIQGLINAAQTNETERPVRKRRISRTPEVDTRLSRSLPPADISLGQGSEDIPINVTEDSTPKKRKFAGMRRESLVDSVRRKRFHFQNSEPSMTLPNSPNKIAMDNSSGEPWRKSPRLASQMEIQSSTTELSSFTSNASQPRNLKRKREKPKFIFSVEKDSSKTSQQGEEAYSLRTTPVSSNVTTPSRILTSTPRRVQPIAFNDENFSIAMENISPKRKSLRPDNDEIASFSNRSSLSILRSSARMSDNDNDENLINSPRKNNTSFSRKTPEETTESLSRRILNEDPEESFIGTPNTHVNQDETPRTPNRHLRSVDFNRVKQSTQKTPTQTEMKSPSRINVTPISQRNARRLAASQTQNIVDRTMPSGSKTGDNERPMHGMPGRDTVMTPAFERTALGPRHSSPVSRTQHITLTGDENLPDVSMIERQEKTFYQDDLDRTEQYRLKTPHLGPPRLHVPTPSDTPVPQPLVTQPVKDKQTNRSKATKKPRVKVQSLTLPAVTIRQTFNHFCKMRVDKDTLPELVKITDEYFDRVAQDLEAFAHHAGRKTIDERDAELLLKRQKIITNTTSLTHLVEKYLPMELRQEIIPMARSGNKIFPGN